MEAVAQTSVRAAPHDHGMSQNFLTCDRDQALLMPPSLREWLPDDHLAWFVLEAVEQMDLEPFYAAYRTDGWGRAAHDPRMMVALLLYAYAVGERSARAIERRCSEDVGFRVITANQAPDHATIARFRVRHQDALAGLFGEVLGLCAKAHLVSVAVLAIDSTKLHANASGLANRSYEQIAKEIIEEAGRIDAAEDERFGERRGDELPPELADPRTRREWLHKARRELQEEQAARPAPSSRAERLAEGKRRLEEQQETERRAVAELEARRSRHHAETGKQPVGRPPKPRQRAASPPGKVNLTDPDSRSVRTARGFIQGYNAQAATTEDQIVVAAEVTIGSADGGQLEPISQTVLRELNAAGIEQAPEVVLADAGYWHKQQIERLAAQGIPALVPPDGHARADNARTRRGGIYEFMRKTLAGGRGRELYRRRQVMVEPVFAHIKVGRRADRFQRRGLAACRAEWRLITATHNLLKLHRHGLAFAAV
jgi:transposase